MHGVSGRPDGAAHNITFNICTTTSAVCAPAAWDAGYAFGVAVEYWGGPPPLCDATHPPTCVNPDNTSQPICCTQECAVLGAGVPNVVLRDAADPAFGGVLLTHQILPPPVNDTEACAVNPLTGAPRPRELVYELLCALDAPAGTLTDVSAHFSEESCRTTIQAKTLQACACVPNCANKNCGPDGCGGFCNFDNGLCPPSHICTAEQVCCRPDCRGRLCGDDGCDGSCGDCPPHTNCTMHQVCGTLQV